jgi:8-oxo-dGTP pyrophosphatase MutT (NUDIX family)
MLKKHRNYERMRVGSPAWDKRGQAFLLNLERRLKDPKPGLAAQLKMAPNPRPGQRVYSEVEGTCLKAGVLPLLYPREGELHLSFIRRTSSVLHHKDQIGFPGGQVEKGETYERAALREAEEELGIPAERVKILGALTPLYIPPSNYCIYPFVGLISEPPAFKPFPEEVAEIIEIPLSRLMDQSIVRRETWMLDRGPVEVPFYALGSHKIWGATAMVLAEFLELLKPAPSRPA